MTDSNVIVDNATVWKYVLPAQQEVTIKMPRGARILRLDFKNHDLCLWAMVDADAAPMERRFEIRGTGQEAAGLWWETYIGTAIHPTADLVLHVWETTRG